MSCHRTPASTARRTVLPASNANAYRAGNFPPGLTGPFHRSNRTEIGQTHGSQD